MISLDSHLQIMHLIDAKNKTIIRMHKPELYDDDLTNVRPMVRDVNRDKKLYKGFEIGRNGITYRISSPIQTKEKEHIGVLEFGIKPSYFVEEVGNMVAIKAEWMVKTDNLKNLTNNEKREQIGEYSIIDSAPIFRILNSQIDLEKKRQVLSVGGKTYAVFNEFSINGHAEFNEVKIVFVKDVSELIQTYKDSLFAIYAVNGFIALIIALLLMKGLKIKETLERSLKELNASLEEKVKRRTDEQNVLLSLFDRGDSVLFKWKNDKSLSVEFASLGVSELLGYELSDIVENKITYASCVHEDDSQRVREETTKAKLNANAYFKHEPYRIVTRDGSIKWVVEYTIVIRNEKGEITHYIGHVTDISEQKRVEDQLMEQSRMAQMGEMISMIAHQWRQPLGAIAATSIDLNMKLELELFEVETQKGRDESQKYFVDSLNQINSLVDSLTNTIDDFRNFYKPDKTKALSQVNLPVQKAFQILEGSLKVNNVEVVQDVQSETELYLHVNELMQVVLNVMQNASDNFSSKDVKNPKRTLKTFDSSEACHIEICDNGGGIPNEIIGKIFDPYFSTKNEKNGTGLGLYMSKKIVEEHHNGKLSVDNSSDGCCFRIEINKKEEKNENR